jgi:uncharacterized 2Fe-2S/4Fe-4S cluster protein (DUF4445 family)
VVKVKIIPLDETIKIKEGSNLGTALQDLGFELPCGGQGSCGKCKIKILKGSLAESPIDRKFLDQDQLQQGWRLACQHKVEEDLVIEVEQWELKIKETRHYTAEEASGTYGISVDAGSTTIAGHLVDLGSGNVLMTQVCYNTQKKYGADIMTRMSYARENGVKDLKKELNNSIYRLVGNLSEHAKNEISKINIVGNTFIHHVFCSLNLEPLMTIPYRADSLDQCKFLASDLNWSIKGNPEVKFLPNLGGYVGSDILAGILSTNLHQKENICLLIDIGTNGEIVLGNRDKLYFSSTAAGPAFEGGKITMGMRADKGAITHAHCENGEIIAETKNSHQPKGICGSGLLDAVACGLQLNKIDTSGKINHESGHLIIQEPVKIFQKDIRELQLAKGAIAAGIDILMQKAGIQPDQIKDVYLAGAFGNYLRVESAIIIGLLNMAKQKINSEGNTALKGAILSLFKEDYKEITNIAQRIELNLEGEFQNIFVKNMNFPQNYKKFL